MAVISIILSSRSFIRSSDSVILLLIPSGVLFICLFFSSCRSLINISYIFSIFASVLFPKPWIIFTIILNYFSGRLPLHLVVFLGFYLVPSSGTYLSAFSSWLTFCNMVFVLATMRLCLFLLLLSAFWLMRLRGRDWQWEKVGLAQ